MSVDYEKEKTRLRRRISELENTRARTMTDFDKIEREIKKCLNMLAELRA